MTAAQMKRLQDQARQFWLQAKRHLEASAQPGNRRGMASGIDRWKFSTGQVGGPTNPQPGGLTLQAGQSVSDKDVERFIEQLGGNPYAKQLSAAKRSSSTGVGNAQMQRLQAQSGQTPAGSDLRRERLRPGGYRNPTALSDPAAADPTALFQKILAQQEAGYAEAKAANEGRYAEGKGLLQDTGAYRQELAQNWGKAAAADIDERMQESLKETAANLASRGLSNSSVMDAFRTRTARDTAREQQRVSEMRDERLANYAAQDAGNLVNFIERRSDPYPDRSEALRLAAQMGQMQMMQQEAAAQRAAQERAEQQRRAAQPSISANQLPPIAGPRGGVTPAFVPFAPVQMGMGLLPQYAPPMAPQQRRRLSYAEQKARRALKKTGVAPPVGAAAAAAGAGVGGVGSLAMLAAMQQGSGARPGAPNPNYRPGDAKRAVTANMQRKRDKQWDAIEAEEARKQAMRNGVGQAFRFAGNAYNAYNGMLGQAQQAASAAAVDQNAMRGINQTYQQLYGNRF